MHNHQAESYPASKMLSPERGCIGKWVLEELCGVCRWTDRLKRTLSPITMIMQGLFSKTLKSNAMIWFLLFFLLSAQRSFCQLKQCWNSTGELRPDLPCDPSANTSACCGQGYICSKSFYCTIKLKNGGHLDGVASCTDKTWSDPACPLPLSQPMILSLNFIKVAL